MQCNRVYNKPLIIMLSLLIALSLVYAFLNGYRDSSNILAGVIASRAMHPCLVLYLGRWPSSLRRCFSGWRWRAPWPRG